MIKKINWKARLTNKWSLGAIISGILLILNALGIMTLPQNWEELVDKLLWMLVAAGVVVDPTSPGFFDSTKVSKP
jgi:phi LC3 family holin